MHGDFEQLPHNHVNGKGCKECGGEQQARTKAKGLGNFVQQGQQLHIDESGSPKYDYSKFVYVNNSTKGVIVCPGHGDFKQVPASHINTKNGCPRCYGNEKRTMNSFIRNAQHLHKDEFGIPKYNYSKFVYVNNKTKGIITCSNHGDFDQNPDSHINKKTGCPECTHLISNSEIEWLDSLGIDKDQRQLKNMINNKRYIIDGFDPLTNTIYEYYGDYWHGNPKIYERKFINKRNHKTMGELYDELLLKEQLLKAAGYNLVTIWESEWKKSMRYDK